MSVPTIKSTDQTIGAFGTKTDAISLARNFIDGMTSGDSAKIGQAATDAIKLGIYYADVLGKATGNTALLNSAASLALKLDNLNARLKTGQATTYADWAEVVSEVGNLGGDIALQYGKNPAALEAGLYLKGGSVLISYSAVAFGNMTITEQAQTIDNGRNALQQIDTAMGGSSSVTINLNAQSVGLSQDALDGTSTSVSILSSSNNALVVQRLDKDLTPTETFEVYTVQPGDTLSDIASTYGLSSSQLQKFNTDITNPDLIYAGEQIYVPISKSDSNASFAPTGVTVGQNQFCVGGSYSSVDLISYATGCTMADLQAANLGINLTNLIVGQVLNLPSATNTFSCTVTDPLGIGSSGATDPTTPVNADNSTLISTGVYTVCGKDNVNTASGNTAYANNQIAGIRHGSYSLVDQILDSQFAQNTCLDPNTSLADSTIGAALNTIGSGVLYTDPTDPLVLDLNGDGVKLTSFSDAPVLFDINHDGVLLNGQQTNKDITGWVSAQDGIVVMDLNGNGKIDDISETMSEYFNSQALGQKTKKADGITDAYANGFAALKSLGQRGQHHGQRGQHHITF